MDMKIELLSVPVADIDRAKEFYVRAGFTADHDHTVSPEIRFVQLTPPGSACSIVLDLNFSPMTPGSQKGIQCVVASADEALAFLRDRGIEASEIDETNWGRFVYFDDADGNGWALQELPDYSTAG
jgi:catechol 2,3-dioxygenase-like lactoylglutathione lyase family enzyme